MREKIIIGNWKMHKTIREAVDFIRVFDAFSCQCRASGIEVGIAPSFMCLPFLDKLVQYTSLVAQNVNAEPEGAFTGEVSIPMLYEAHVKYCLVGHSERRAYYNETNAACNAKNKALFANYMLPVYCVGETLQQYEAGQSKDVVHQQLVEGLKDLTPEQVATMVIAYEPVWSIGTGKNASVAIAEDICGYIRHTVSVLFNAEAASKVRIQYGGSVKPENAKEYLSCEDIDGVLVGGASLKPDSFKALISTIL